MRASSVEAVSATTRTSGARANTRCVVSMPSMPPGSSKSCRTTCGRHSSSRSRSSSPVVAIPTSFRSGKDSRYACRLRPTTRWSSTMAIEIGMSMKCVKKPRVKFHSDPQEGSDGDEYDADADRNSEDAQKFEAEVIARAPLIVHATGGVESETRETADSDPRECAAHASEQR